MRTLVPPAAHARGLRPPRHDVDALHRRVLRPIRAEPASTPPFKLRLPIGPGDQADQAAAALQRAWQAGATRASVRLLLPVTGGTDLDDWPGGARQQAETAIPLVERVLSTLKKVPGLEGSIDATVLDRADGVGAWTSPRLAAVMLPTAETLKTCVQYAEDRDAVGGLTLLVNPAWVLSGNLISDFGVGPWRAAAEKNVASFRLAYALDALRVAGDTVRLLYLQDAGWSVWLLDGKDERLLADGLADRPTVAAVTDLLKATPGTAAGAPLADRLRREIGFLKDTL